jgi:hypothetical protein
MTCCCFRRDLTDADITHYITTDSGAVWAVFRRCELHNCAATSPVWSPEIGMLHDETAPANQAETVSEGLSNGN